MVHQFISRADWRILEEKLLVVSKFIPVASLNGSEVLGGEKNQPYAFLQFTYPDNSSSGWSPECQGAVTHKSDFRALWWAFRTRGVGEDETLTACWSERQFKPYARFIPFLMPHLGWCIFKSDALRLLTDKEYRTDLSELDRLHAERPLLQRTPDAWEGSFVESVLDRAFWAGDVEDQSFIDEVYSIIAGPNIANRPRSEILESVDWFLNRWASSN